MDMRDTIVRGSGGITKNHSVYGLLADTWVVLEDGRDTVEWPIHLQVGKQYLVHWDGTEYQCEGTLFVDPESGVMCVGLGNPVIIGMQDNGLPFVLMDLGAELGVMSVDGSNLRMYIAIEELRDTLGTFDDDAALSMPYATPLLTHTIKCSADTMVTSDYNWKGFEFKDDISRYLNLSAKYIIKVNDTPFYMEPIVSQSCPIGFVFDGTAVQYYQNEQSRPFIHFDGSKPIIWVCPWVFKEDWADSEEGITLEIIQLTPKEKLDSMFLPDTLYVDYYGRRLPVVVSDDGTLRVAVEL